MQINNSFSLIQNSSERVGEITHLVIHFMSNIIAHPENPFVIEECVKILADNQVSAHYIIDREGNIYSLVPESRSAWHAGRGSLPAYPDYENNLNQYSIGIELLATGTQENMSIFFDSDRYQQIPDEHLGYTEAQMISVNILINDILNRNQGIVSNRDHVIGHDEWSPGRRTDPGALFDWNKLDFVRKSKTFK